MKNKKVVINTGELSALVLKGFELVFFRRHLGLEKVVPEMAKVRNDYIFNILVPALNDQDIRIAGTRNKYAKKTASGQLRTLENGMIDYGEDTQVARAEFEAIIGENVILPVNNKEEFATVRGIFQALKQELNEDETIIYLEVVKKLNAVEL